VSFVVSHPFEESSYPEDLRSKWKAMPDRVKDKIMDMGRKFGQHAMVEGAVPVLFDDGTDELLLPLIDGKYIQSIPEVYGGNPATFWVDASLLNYAMLVNQSRAAEWMPIAITGTDSCIVSNVGDGAAIDVDVVTENETIKMTVRSSTIWVQPNQGILLTFEEDVPNGTELKVGWTSESGEAVTSTLTLPAITHSSLGKAGLKAVA